jgi:hypothetical protein
MQSLPKLKLLRSLFCRLTTLQLYSSPSEAGEKSCNFRGRPIRIFAVREMADAWKHSKIEVRKCFAEPVGPGIRKQAIMLRPTYAGRHYDGRLRRRFAFHHGDASRMGGAIVREPADKISWLKEVVRERRHHVGAEL